MEYFWFLKKGVVFEIIFFCYFLNFFLFVNLGKLIVVIVDWLICVKYVVNLFIFFIGEMVVLIVIVKLSLVIICNCG